MTEKDFRLKRIFEESLAKIEKEGLLDDVLLNHEDLAGELASLIEADRLLKAHLLEEEPSSSFAARLERNLLETFTSSKGHASRSPLYKFTFDTMSNLAKLAAALILTFMVIGGTAAASMGSLPTSPLYAIKKGAETARLALATNNEAKARLHVKFASERLKEAESLSESGEGAVKEALIKEFDDNLEKAKSLALGSLAEERAALLAKADEISNPASYAMAEPKDSAAAMPSPIAHSGENLEPVGEKAGGAGLGAAGGRASLESLRISDFAVDNYAFSPNGDGVKDSVTIVFKAKSGQKLFGSIFRGDIEIISKLPFAEDKGSYHALWDGKDAAGAPIYDGAYSIRVSDHLGRKAMDEVRIILDTAAPVFSLLSPEDGRVFKDEEITFAWQAVGDAARYVLQISKAPDFKGDNVLTFRGLSDNQFSLDFGWLDEGRRYYRVICIDRAGNSSSTSVLSFWVESALAEDA